MHDPPGLCVCNSNVNNATNTHKRTPQGEDVAMSKSFEVAGGHVQRPMHDVDPWNYLRECMHSI